MNMMPMELAVKKEKPLLQQHQVGCSTLQLNSYSKEPEEESRL